MTRVRRLLPLLFVVVPAFAAHAVPGDVNGDGSVTLEDATLASRIASRLQPPTYDDLAAADVASVAGPVRDARVDVWDVEAILRVAAGFSHFLDASAPGDALDSPAYTFDLSSDRTRDFQFRIVKVPSTSLDGVTVSGHVSGITESVEDPIVWFVRFGDSGIHASGTGVGPDGAYDRNLATGDYSLYFGGTAIEAAEGGRYAWGFAAPVGREVNVSAPMTVDLTAPATPPAGLVTGSLALGNLVATAVSGQRQPTSTPDAWLPVNTRAAGIVGPAAYSLKAAPGSYGLTLSASYPPDPSVSFQISTGAVDVAAGETSTRDVSLPDAVPVTFDIVPAPDGKVKNISLSGHLGNPRTTVSATADFTEEATSYTTVAPPGDYSVNAQIALTSPPGDEVTLRMRGGLKTVPPGGGTITIAIPPLHMVTLRGRVTYPNGAPAFGARIDLTPYQSVPDALVYASTLTDEDGEYALTVPTGSYQARATAFAAR